MYLIVSMFAGLAYYLHITKLRYLKIRFFSELVVVKRGKKGGLSIKTEWTSGIS
jgi:hypothetical protein